jgi:glycine/D-amino acid oxidase-like deaminating enzyme
VTAPSYWLEDVGDQPPRPPLDGSVDVDVAVLGAGFTGLWSAWYLRRRDPSLRIALVEAEYAGFGASGRNGAWCSAGIGTTPGELARRHSPDVARQVVGAMRNTVDEVERVCAAEGIDAHYRKGGLLRIARGPHELPAIDEDWDELHRLGLDDGCSRLDASDLHERVRVNRAAGALADRHCATVHPGRLVHGLARLVEDAGATIYEHTPVTAFVSGKEPRLRTPQGDVRARVVLLAGEAWLSQLPGMRRALLPVYSLVVLTEPLGEEHWEEIGWRNGECLSSRRYTIDYLSRTADGRILFGGRGAPYHFGSRIAPAYDRHAATHEMLRRQLVDWFPMLTGVRITHAWGGPIGMPRDWMPTFRYEPGEGLAGAYGYTGQGVAASNLAGRVLADLLTGEDSDLTSLPMVGHRSRPWEPEPLRWLGARYLQWSLARIDARGERTGRPPSGRSLAERLMRH